MGEVSHDLDDVVCYPTALQALFPCSFRHRGRIIRTVQSALLIQQPKEVRRAVGRHFLREDVLGADETYGRAKVLLSAIENGASCEAWLRKQPAQELRCSTVDAELQISPSQTFNLAAFAREQDARTCWLAATRPELIHYLGAINALMDEGLCVITGGEM